MSLIGRRACVPYGGGRYEQRTCNERLQVSGVRLGPLGAEDYLGIATIMAR